jgi:hypothetical protein
MAIIARLAADVRAGWPWAIKPIREETTRARVRAVRRDHYGRQLATCALRAPRAC